MKTILPLALAALLAGCPTHPPAPMPPDASDASPPPPEPAGDAAPQLTPCAAACAALQAIGCEEGSPPPPLDCARKLAQVESSRVRRAANRQPLTCMMLAGVKSKADVRAVLGPTACP